MANYYFLGTLLPDLRLDEKPEIDFNEFKQLLSENLSPGDYAKTNMIRNFYDIFNLRAYWKGEELDPLGNFDTSELEEALATQTLLPRYIFDFLNKYESKEDRLRHFPELLSAFFQEEIKRHGDPFNASLKAYLMMERDIRLILVAFRAKQLGRDVLVELQYEDPEDEIVAQIIAQKDSPQYEPPEKYADMKPIFDRHLDDPLGLQKALIEYRFVKIEEILGQDLFSSDRIFAYMAELIMVERWLRLDKKNGLEIVDSMLKEAS